MPKRKPDNTSYKILLEPYPTDKYFSINHIYRIKFPYGLITAKPNPCLQPDWNIYYDAILCHSKYEASYFKVFSNPIVIGSLKYKSIKSNSNNEKQTLLYLPTYGELSSIDELINTLHELKSKYYIIVKFHHGTSFLNNEKNRLDNLKNVVDEWYDLNTNLSDLFTKSDVVLSDNSSATFEALYNNIPVAIFSNNINKKLGDFNTLQHDLVESNILPYTNQTKNIPEILSLACSDEYRKKQNNIKEQLFYISDKAESEFLEAIKNYLNDNINLKYKQLHDVLVNDYILKNNLIKDINKKNELLSNKISKQEQEYMNLQNNNLDLQNLTNFLKSQIEAQNKILSEYDNGKLYRVAKKFIQSILKFLKIIRRIYE